MKSYFLPGALLTLAALCLAGCIDSAEPILTDAKPVFGQTFRAQLYSLNNGHAEEPALEQFNWDGKRYVSTSAKPQIEPFTAFPYGPSGDFIVQTVSATPPAKAEYALLHKLADGVFLGRVIDEDDADDATKKLCTKLDRFTCRIQTRDQLLAFAKATAAKQYQSGGLVIMLAEPQAQK